jgi:hypothetical protein
VRRIGPAIAGGVTALAMVVPQAVAYAATTGDTTVTILAQSLSVPRTAFTLTLGVGDNSATWNPTLIVSVPASAVAGVYTGTVTHSVAP